MHLLLHTDQVGYACSHIVFVTYRKAGYIGGNDVGRIARKRKKTAIGGYIIGDYWLTRYIATPSPGGWHNIGRFTIGGVTGTPPISQL